MINDWWIAEIDLIDEDGEIKQLSQLLQHDQQSCGTFFTDRAIYYLIRVDSRSRDYVMSWLLCTVARDRQ